MINDKNSSPLAVLLEVKERHEFKFEDDLIKDFYELHKDHQYEKDRHTIAKMKSIVEEYLKGEQES